MILYTQVVIHIPVTDVSQPQNILSVRNKGDEPYPARIVYTFFRRKSSELLFVLPFATDYSGHV